MGKTICWNI